MQAIYFASSYLYRIFCGLQEQQGNNSHGETIDSICTRCVTLFQQLEKHFGRVRSLDTLLTRDSSPWAHTSGEISFSYPSPISPSLVGCMQTFNRYVLCFVV
ncbi:hypothetical protein HNY73_002360 [Argiope bruennichi]|uniref:Uncharacterized protein n=1 Tax=Argiope bruennichi TaxID=94029 RepID=A0A8T0FUK8_ARGBR|nr:hypothetical protein HNY73_002360 [Argiope bruennichi]